MMSIVTQGNITSVADLLNAVKISNLTTQPHAHIRVWFRGHGDTSWKLRPGVYRDGFALDEEQRVKKERHLTQDFEVMSAALRNTNQTDPEIYFLQQHYRMPTRLLDWSTNPLAALFFALDPNDKDGFVFLLDSYLFKPFKGIHTSRSPILTESLKAIFDWNDAAWPKDILAVRPSSLEKRVNGQRGYFTFHPPTSPELTLASNTTIRRFMIPAASKESLKQELDLLGVDEAFIYGDLDHLAERLKRAYRDF